VGFRKPVTSPLAFRHLLVVLGEPQLSQSSTAKVVRRIGHLGTSPDFMSGPTLENQRPPAGPVSAAPAGALDHLSLTDPFVKLQFILAAQTVKLGFEQGRASSCRVHPSKRAVGGLAQGPPRGSSAMNCQESNL
jgi:hypothetical protein